MLVADSSRAMTSIGGSVAVLSDGFWQRRFGGDPRVIGMPVRIKENSYTVVGIAAEDFAGLEAHQRTDVWVPLNQHLATDRH